MAKPLLTLRVSRVNKIVQGQSPVNFSRCTFSRKEIMMIYPSSKLYGIKAILTLIWDFQKCSFCPSINKSKVENIVAFSWDISDH